MWSEEIIEVNIYKYELMMQYTKDNTGMNSLKKCFSVTTFPLSWECHIARVEFINRQLQKGPANNSQLKVAHN